jgi:uncharacterized spore protein YtfJ
MEQNITNNQDVTQYVDTLFANMKSFSQHDGMIGKPVTEGGKTFLPVISVTMGYGGGDSHSHANTGTQAKTGMMGDVLGVGAKLCTDAVIVIDGNNVLLAPIGAKGGVAQMIEKIPQIIGGMGQGGQQPQQQQQTQQQNKGY